MALLTLSSRIRSPGSEPGTGLGMLATSPTATVVPSEASAKRSTTIAVVHGEAELFGQFGVGDDADADQHDLRGQHRAVLELDAGYRRAAVVVAAEASRHWC